MGECCSPEDRVGTTLGCKYVLERLIGVGSAAAVYRGRHRNGYRVAIKVLHPQISGNRELRALFLREGYVANRVDHHGAVRVFDEDVAADGSVFLVMELLEGETLDSRWERAGQRLPHGEVARLVHALLDVLAAAHARSIVHRDIKPENLFLTRDERLKVLDFGIARLMEQGAPDVAAGLTSSSVGTPVFMAPEQVSGQPGDIDAKTDLWAVGATMFTLLSGRYVREGSSLDEVLLKAATQRVRPLSSVAPDVSPGLAALVDRAVAFDRDQRFDSARSMQRALERLYPDLALLPASKALSSRPGVGDVASSESFDGRQGDPPDVATAASDSQGPIVVTVVTAPGKGSEAPGAQAAKDGRGRYRGTPTAAIAGVLAFVALGLGGVLLHDAGSRPSVAAGRAPAGTGPTRMVDAPPVCLQPSPTRLVERTLSPTSVVPGAAPALATGKDDGGEAPGLQIRPAEARPKMAAASCDPPFKIDEAGRRIPKLECL
jgi:eukaryotic-like serine/threonine-protein kinase